MTGLLERLIVVDALTFFLVFCRLGAALMVLPGFGEAMVAPRVRLLLALAFSLAVAPVVGPALGTLPRDGSLLLLLVGELAIGLFVGLTARLMVSALQIAGSIIAVQTSLAGAMAFDPGAGGQQGTVTASFLGLLGLVMIFATDLHHLLLAGLVDSYALFVPGRLPPVDGLVDTIARVVADAFRVGLQLAAPFVLVGIVVTIAMGLLARLMPQVQIFFIALPVQLTIGFAVLALTVAFGMRWFLDGFAQSFAELFVSG